MPDRTGSLCICLTPLHVLIAGRIAAFRGESFTQGVYLTSADNAKNRHYAEEMRRFCLKSEYLIVPGEDSYGRARHFSIWIRRWRFRRAFRRFGPVGTVYVPSSLNHYIYIFLSAFEFLDLHTFDDGLINVLRNSPLVRWRTTALAKVFFLAAGIVYWPERIRRGASNHYSIYDMENVCSSVLRITLIDVQECIADVTEVRPPDKILFGPAPEAEPGIWKLLGDAVLRFDIETYLPHPREARRMIDGIRYLDTPLVAEDYILNRLKAEPDLSLKIYGYDSSALINLARTPRIEAYCLLGTASDPSGIRSLMEKSGVVIVS